MDRIKTTLGALFQELADGICLSDSGGKILYLNPAAERLLDFTIAEVRDRSLCDVLCGRLTTPGSPECASHCPLRDPASAEKTVTFSGQYNRKSLYEWGERDVKRVDNWRNLRVRCLKVPMPWLDHGRPEKHLCIIEDISAQYELERQREDWRSMIAHDLRVPLTTIYAVLRTIQEEASGPKPMPPNQDLLQRSVQACRKMTELLTLYLEVAKFDAGLMPVHSQRVNLLESVQACTGEQIDTAEAKSVKIAVDIDPAMHLRTDPNLLSRVIDNLLNNAIKFTPGGGQVTIAARPEKNSISLSVRDTGPGIGKDELPLIFDRYHQARARREGKIQGNGLGLAFCWEAVKALRGRILVESPPGSGAIFTVILPSAD